MINREGCEFGNVDISVSDCNGGGNVVAHLLPSTHTFCAAYRHASPWYQNLSKHILKIFYFMHQNLGTPLLSSFLSLLLLPTQHVLRNGNYNMSSVDTLTRCLIFLLTRFLSLTFPLFPHSVPIIYRHPHRQCTHS